MLVDNKRQRHISVLRSIAFDMEVEEEGAMSCLYVRRKKHIYIKVTAD